MIDVLRVHLYSVLSRFSFVPICRFHRFQLYSILLVRFGFRFGNHYVFVWNSAQIECAKKVWKRLWTRIEFTNANMELSIFLCTHRLYGDSGYNRLLMKLALVMLSNGVDKFRYRIQVFCITEPIQVYRVRFTFFKM